MSSLRPSDHDSVSLVLPSGLSWPSTVKFWSNCKCVTATFLRSQRVNVSLRPKQGGDVAQLVRASDRYAADVGSNSPVRQGIFLPESTFSADCLTCVSTPPCAIACINICAHVKNSVVYVRVRWIKETLKRPACIVGLVARLCRSWLSPGKATRIFHGRNPIGTIQL